jgi:hypothetical protein
MGLLQVYGARQLAAKPGVSSCRFFRKTSTTLAVDARDTSKLPACRHFSPTQNSIFVATLANYISRGDSATLCKPTGNPVIVTFRGTLERPESKADVRTTFFNLPDCDLGEARRRYRNLLVLLSSP